METHIVGANHYKRIGARFNWRLPPLEEAEDLNKPWVERFQTPKGPFFFNHVTGTHGFVEEAGETPVPPESSSAAAAYEPPTAAAPAPYPTPPSVAMPSSTATGATCPLTGLSTQYESGLMSTERGDWRRYMEPIAVVAADALAKANGGWDFYSCPVCEQENTRGLVEHVCSDKHWRTLGAKFHWRPPPPTEAHAMDKSTKWVQTIQTRSGDFLFNHLTGRYCLVQQPAGPGAAAPATAPAAPVVSGGGGPPVTGGAAAPAAAAPPPTPGKQNHAYWLWVNTVRVAAEQVEELLAHPEFQGSRACSVCGEVPLSKQHLLSREHFNTLQQRAENIPGDVWNEAMEQFMEGCPTALGEESRPWVQRLELHRPYFLNHITGTPLWQQQQW